MSDTTMPINPVAPSGAAFARDPVAYAQRQAQASLAPPAQTAPSQSTGDGGMGDFGEGALSFGNTVMFGLPEAIAKENKLATGFRNIPFNPLGLVADAMIAAGGGKEKLLEHLGKKTVANTIGNIAGFVAPAAASIAAAPFTGGSSLGALGASGGNLLARLGLAGAGKALAGAGAKAAAGMAAKPILSTALRGAAEQGLRSAIAEDPNAMANVALGGLGGGVGAVGGKLLGGALKYFKNAPAKVIEDISLAGDMAGNSGVLQVPMGLMKKWFAGGAGKNGIHSFEEVEAGQRGLANFARKNNIASDAEMKDLVSGAGKEWQRVADAVDKSGFKTADIAKDINTLPSVAAYKAATGNAASNELDSILTELNGGMPFGAKVVGEPLPTPKFGDTRATLEKFINDAYNSADRATGTNIDMYRKLGDALHDIKSLYTEKAIETLGEKGLSQKLMEVWKYTRPLDWVLQRNKLGGAGLFRPGSETAYRQAVIGALAGGTGGHPLGAVAGTLVAPLIQGAANKFGNKLIGSAGYKVRPLMEKLTPGLTKIAGAIPEKAPELFSQMGARAGKLPGFGALQSSGETMDTTDPTALLMSMGGNAQEGPPLGMEAQAAPEAKIGRASCRERV